jgi:hypothetical protein
MPSTAHNQRTLRLNWCSTPTCHALDRIILASRASDPGEPSDVRDVGRRRNFNFIRGRRIGLVGDSETLNYFNNRYNAPFPHK